MTRAAVERRGPAGPLRRLRCAFGSIVATGSDGIVMTFDDGPDPRVTPRVLEVLERHRAGATFFVLLSNARSNPSLVREVLAAGHEVALHGPDHRALTGFGHGRALRRTSAAKAELEDLLGGPVRWFRPPYGYQSPSTLLATRRAGLVPVLWNATTWDWKDVSDEQRLAKAREGGRPGSILLAHDGRTEDAVSQSCDTASLVDRVLRDYALSGLRALSLAEALAEADAVCSLRFTRGPRHRPRATALR